MSILNALKQHGGSIDELARLPQAMIMQMAQRKEIGAEMVAPILARKAQMVDAVARTKALQKGGASMPSVMEQLMQKTADQENPAEVTGVGVGQLPIPERNYAGGGIVAFAEAGPVEDKNLPERLPGETDNAYMQRVQALASAGKQFFTPSNYNPINKLGDLYDMYNRNIGQPFAESAKRFANESPESQAAKFEAASNARKNVSATNVALNTPTINNTPNQAEIYAIRATNKVPVAEAINKPPTTSPTSTSPTSTGNRPTGLKSLTSAPNVEQTGPKQPSELENALAQSRAEISGNADDAKKAREEAKWNRLLEAGLNVMGGQSTNFAQNLALAGQAAKGYGEDTKGLRAEETERRKQLAALNLKGAELRAAEKKAGVEEKYMGQHGKYFEQAGQAALTTASHAGDIAGLRADLGAQQLALKTQQAADLALEKAGYGLLATSKKPEKIQQAAAMKEAIYRQYGIFPGGAAAPTIGGYNPTTGQQAALNKYLPQ